VVLLAGCARFGFNLVFFAVVFMSGVEAITRLSVFANGA
jgi:hypothetical protein